MTNNITDMQKKINFLMLIEHIAIHDDRLLPLLEFYVQEYSELCTGCSVKYIDWRTKRELDFTFNSFRIYGDCSVSVTMIHPEDDSIHEVALWYAKF